MICYRDMTFCTDSMQCANSGNCFRNYSELDKKRAMEMKLPIALGSFKSHCINWRQDDKD